MAELRGEHARTFTEGTPNLKKWFIDGKGFGWWHEG